jgi:murein L,D-transpeptidase YafK
LPSAALQSKALHSPSAGSRLALTLGLALACVLPASALAQAGSRPALLFDSAASFYSAIAGSVQGGSGVNQGDAVAPAGALKLPASARFLLWVELASGQLNVLEQVAPDSLVLRKRIPVSIGKRGIGKLREGDKKTPVGVYRLTSRLDDSQLDDFYGIGAYPLNYPNARDQQLGRTGHGIWLHGLPKHVGERPLLDSDGCIVVDNESLVDLAANISTGETWIVMSPDDIQWVASDNQHDLRDSLDAALKAWELAWEARDNNAYLSFYAADFSDLQRDKAQWSGYKTRVNNSKHNIQLEFSDMSMMLDPQQNELVTVRYYQSYRSDNYNWAGWKEQVWRNSPEGWQIIYEGDS